jgi:hypothetical protein
MRTFKLIAVAALAISTAACVETVDQGYGYSNGYYAPNYAQPAYYGSNYYAPSYYTPAPQVVTQTRYVPVPVAVPQHEANRSNDHRWDGNRGDQRHDHPQANNNPQPAPQQPSNNGGNSQHHGNGGNSNSHDRDGDGRPDRRS